jgi:23S rRNA (cytidine2498-2'-O)-methyltransferase
MSASIEPFPHRLYLPFPELDAHFDDELTQRFGISPEGTSYGQLRMLKEAIPGGQVPYWCRTAMLEPYLVHFDSIRDASDALRNMQRSWAPYAFTCFRRMSLIQEKLPHVNTKPRAFPVNIPQSPIGLYTLLDEHTMLCSAKTSSSLPCGTLSLIEDHENPPSRAYLKLEEALCVAHSHFGVDLPNENSRCFDAGACPGGWTWVLVQLGASVFAVDRSPLDDRLMNLSTVQFTAHDAFTFEPQDIGPFDWVCSDVICYPQRLLEWIKKWIASGKTKRMICTIKLQGSTDWNLISQFAAIPDSLVLHLSYNKHELTFIHCGK